ncbi:hypothetical protein CCACVL1_29201 [Corchorus capsularis]|uniref:Uncharacterized protein n=1 Tax=Corchorus capsularis TaxID=210143 RepID=A0A1R3G346_COCAP|nr:hypothetical protein CCACVL1_29201 [Corchorus capsularis]
MNSLMKSWPIGIHTDDNIPHEYFAYSLEPESGFHFLQVVAGNGR